MTTRLIEKCFSIDKLEEEEYTNYISLVNNQCLLVVDPYMINIQDLLDAPRAGKAILVRAKRPAWGAGNLQRFIYKIDL